MNRVMRHKLGSDKEKAEEVYVSAILGGNIQDIKAFGNNVYFNESGTINDPYVSNDIRYDIVKNTISVLPKDSQYVGGGIPMISNKKLYYSRLKESEIHPQNQYKTPYFECDLEGNHVKKVFDIHSPAPTCMDDQMFYCGNFLDLNRATEDKKDSNPMFIVSIYNKSGVLLNSISAPASLLTSFPQLLPGNDSKMFIKYNNGNSLGIKYINKSEITDKNLVLHDLIQLDWQNATPQYQLPRQRRKL
ncbi:MAG: hypothetical protein ACLSAP_00900 [Oscillospiraceae bacterium]